MDFIRRLISPVVDRCRNWGGASAAHEPEVEFKGGVVIMKDEAPAGKESLVRGPVRAVIGILPGCAMQSCAVKVGQWGAKAVFINNLDPKTAAQQMAQLDGLIITGGADVHPSLYNEPNNGSYVGHAPSPNDLFGMACIQEAYRTGLPMLGICRGEQLMNVAGGGSLVQDIPSQWVGPEGQRGGHPGSHPITIEEGSVIHSIVGTTTTRVNSLHHQAVKVPSPLLKVTARAHDGVPEAVEHKDNPGQIGVQFHPEMMNGPVAAAFFKHLVDHAARYRSERVTVTPS